jgi:hypothetical protein
MLLALRLLAVFALVISNVTSVRSATNNISGQITENATWSGTNLLSGTVTIQTNVVVTIEPGTQMLMSSAARLVVYGQLLADGESNAPIRFTRAGTSGTWGRLMFVHALDSRLRHCVIEFANSAGDHKDYYPTNCSPPMFAVRNNYHEAIVALSCHLEIEGCLFQNLPSAGGEGDAIAIISDDPDPTDTNSWNSASGVVRNSRFIEIGQGVHTRYAYVLVEGCYFYSHNGDNDDVDLYGESTPPVLVRSNQFWYAHDDFINPTRCSAIITNNIFIGTNDTDHGIVLRDVCRPIVMNNVIYRCNTGAIATQNGCEGFIINNTIVNCNRAIKLFDHQDRVNPPYCLAAASGKVTLVNNIVWNSTPAFDLSGFAWGNLYVNLTYSDVQGGTNNSVRNAGAIIINGPGNIDANPLFANTAATNFHLLAGSPCIDTGTNAAVFLTNEAFAVHHDFDRVPRPLDGNGDGAPRWDMGAFEYLLATADSNGDGIPDGWTWSHGLNPVDPTVATGNPDNDLHNNLEEWIADTDPTNAQSFFQIASISNEPPVTVYATTSSNRIYTLSYTTNLNDPITWTNVTGQVDVQGTGALRAFTDPANSPAEKFYRINVKVP